jgi:hypothetical protein
LACTHAAAVYDDARGGQRIRRDKRLPVTLDTCFFEREGESLQQGPIVNLCLAGKIQGLLKP